MSEKKMFYCLTGYQLIHAVILKMTVFRNNTADLLIGSHRSYLHCDIGELCKIFDNVFILPFKCTAEGNIQSRLKKSVCSFSGCAFLKKNKINLSEYDQFLYTSNGFCPKLISYTWMKENPQGQISLLDDGLGSYASYFPLFIADQYYPSPKYIMIKNFFRTLAFDIRKIIEHIDAIYLLDPGLACWDMPVKKKQVQVPPFTQENGLTKRLNCIFQYEPQNEAYNFPIIVFEQCFFSTEGFPFIDDYSVICRIVEYAGAKNVTIKLHPNSPSDRFAPLGYRTIQDNSVPWEVVAMNLTDGQKRILITFNSTVVLSTALLLRDNMICILLYKCIPCEKKEIITSTDEVFQKLAYRYPDRVFIPETLDDFFKILDYHLEKGLPN